MLPGRAEAKIDLRLVPDMTKDEAVAKLKAHLAKRGFGDIEVNVSGGYGPTQTDENSAADQGRAGDIARRPGFHIRMSARSAGSWPGVMFTGAPLKLAAAQFGAGRGGGAHAPNEWLLIESSNPKVLGFDDQAILFVDFLYEVARAPRRSASWLGSGRGGQGSPRFSACLQSFSHSRIRLPAASSALRSSRPRFSSASDWLVVAASTPCADDLDRQGHDIDRGLHNGVRSRSDQGRAAGRGKRLFIPASWPNSPISRAALLLGQRFSASISNASSARPAGRGFAADHDHQRHRQRGHSRRLDMDHRCRGAIDQARKAAELGHAGAGIVPCGASAANASARYLRKYVVDQVGREADLLARSCACPDAAARPARRSPPLRGRRA